MIGYADGADSPRSSPDVVARAAGARDESVLLGWTPEGRAWLSSPKLTGVTVLAGYALAEPVADGRLRYLPVRLSAVPRLLSDDLRPEVAVVTGVPRGDGLALAASAGWGVAAALSASAGVVVEVDRDGPDLGAPLIPGRILATIDRPAATLEPPSNRRPDPVELQIGRNVATVLPDEPTLQFGPGGIAEAILSSLDRPVHIWSGLVTESVAELDSRGLLLGPATAAYAWGGSGLLRLARAGRLVLAPVEVTHDVGSVASIKRFVGCNTALQVDLAGSVNIERVGGRYVAGIGGHADFCAAAARSPGGLSVIALRSESRGGESTIVPAVEVVSTPRCDVEIVVTEHGIADLRSADDGERARRMVQVAAPRHRSFLSAAALRLAASAGKDA